MAVPKQSLGYELILADRPDLAFDLEQLPRVMIEKGSLDQIAIELELMRSGESIALRTNALHALSKRVLLEYSAANEALEWIASRDFDIGVWGACVCARQALRFVPESETLPLRLIETAEQYLLGFMPLKEARRVVSVPNPSSNRHAGYAAQYPLLNPSYSAFHASHASHVFGDDYSITEDFQANEILRLVAVIADALPGMPVRVR